MFSDHTSLEPSLVQAYRETHYRVNGPLVPPRPPGHPSLTLLVDEHSLELVDLHLKYGVACSAFITACNPHSVAIADAANMARHANLASYLQKSGLTYLEGIGRHPHNEWPGEPSYLVLGLAMQDAKALATELEQNAFVWSGEDAVPKLVLLK